MLVTNPLARATLPEILSHPWMCRGFNGPPDSHLVHREPLRADELDKQVIRGMTGFEFGTVEEIERKLVQIIESDAYLRAVQTYERKRFGGNGHVAAGSSLSNSSLALSLVNDSSKLAEAVSPTSSTSKTTTTTRSGKRFSGFEFYRKKLFSPASSPPGSPLSNSPPSSQAQLSGVTLVASEPRHDPVDPTRGFHPLLSIYYLAREKMERERVYGPGHFASSQLSVHGVAPSTAEGSVRRRDPVPGGAKADYGMAVPRLPAPATSHYSGMSYDAGAGSGPASAGASPTAATFQAAQQAQPRARDAGLPVPVPLGHHQQHHQPQPVSQAEGGVVSVPSTPVSPFSPATPVPTSAGDAKMPRAPPASTHRRSHSLSQRPTTVRGWAGLFGGGGAGGETNGVVVPSGKAVGELGTFEEKKEEEGGESAVVVERPSTPSGMAHSVSAGATLVRRFGHMFGGGRGGGSSRASRDEGEKEKDPVEGDEKEKEKEKETEKEVVEEPGEIEVPTTDTVPTPVVAPAPKSPEPGMTNAQHRRAATIMEVQGKQSGRHERRSSMGSPFVGGTIGRLRRPSTGFTVKKPLADRLFSRTDEEDEGEVSSEVPRTAGAPVASSVTGAGAPGKNFKEEDERHTSEKDFKPVFLKGLFR